MKITNTTPQHAPTQETATSTQSLSISLDKISLESDNAAAPAENS